MTKLTGAFRGYPTRLKCHTLAVFINEQRNSSFSNSNEVNRRSELRNKQSQFEKYIFRLLQIPFHKMSASIFIHHDKWIPVTTAWRVLRLRMEERPPIWRVAANKLNKQSRTADEGWSSSLGVGRGANNASP